MKVVAGSFVMSTTALLSWTTTVVRGFRSVTASSRGALSSTCRAMSTTAEPSAASSTSTTTNAFLQQDDLPKFAKLDPSELTPAVETLLKQLQQDFAQLEKELQDKVSSNDGDIDFDDVVPTVERMQFPLGYTWGVAGHLNGVQNGPILREQYEANQPKIVQAMSAFSQSQALYQALQTVQQKLEADHDASTDFQVMQKRRAVENSLRGMTLGGVGLQGADKERFNEIKMRLAALSTSFSNNVLDETKAFALTIDDPAIVQGVPDSAKAMWANAHLMHLQAEKGADDIPKTMDPNVGPWRITGDMPSYIAVMSHLPDRNVRQKVYMHKIQTASEVNPEKNNVPAIYEILQLKQEMATMLGFENYAALSLASKMAPSVEAVTELTDLIAAKAIPAAKAELEEITAFAKEKGGEEYAKLDKLEPWDITYWSERLKESKFDLTEEETRPYFALPAVLDGMFSLVERIFNIQVTAADGETEVWNDDVRFFKVTDAASGKHIASFYLDPYSRPADKRGGAWMDVCIGKSSAVNRDVAVAYLTCNGSPPVGDTPSLMTFREVETLFHEFGHGLQHMLTEATVGDVAGINGVEWDAVELPSQFMENWCYDKPTVYGFAKHYKTGEPMPEKMFQKLCDQKTYGAGMMSCRQLYFGQLDMELHSKYDPKSAEKEGGETIWDVQKRVASKYIPHSMPLPEDRFLCSFQHIFAGGYAAGYYSYKWAEVMSADAFAAFEEAGLDDEEKVKQVGKTFRETVLSLGGGVPPMEVFKRFRGREPSPDALLRHTGLA
uniref:oligopeptidase A n=1 Tax=Amphora coffeiformis TaxID=265554 RepID=A0A7S3L827_9STRA|mmetsp:Transcript_6255/g.12511  ORF Transcript_6255/g.12511 Transcript_6255/m.12511 type:complete len:781 (-) Transcript_6255:91-2433(-)